MKRKNPSGGFQVPKIDFKKIDYWVIALSAISLFFRMMVPAALALNSPHDDLLGVEQAKSLIEGQWLGAWNNRILAKPPGYAFFLYFNHFLRISPTVSLHLILLLISYLFSKKMSGYLASDNQNLIKRLCFGFLIFNPVVYANGFSRIYRVGANTLLIFAFAYILLECISIINNRMLNGKKLSSDNAWITFMTAGFIYSLLILTRSESFWILLGPLLIFIFFSLGRFYQDRKNPKILKRNVKNCIIAFLIFFISWQIPMSIVGTINQNIYGVNATDNFFTGNFADAIKKWESVKTGRSIYTSVPVSAAQRAIVYNVSPTAKALKPALDGPPNTGWKVYNCSATKICNESGGGWFPWELRDAAVSTFNIQNETSFQAIFKQISDDISNACNARTIKCDYLGTAPGSQPLQVLPKNKIIESTANSVRSLFRMDQTYTDFSITNTSDRNLLDFWHSVISFDNLTSRDIPRLENTKKIILGLTNLYKILIYIGYGLLVLSFFRRKKFPEITFWQTSMFISLIVFNIGIGIFELSIGFTPDYSLYTLPGQLLFVALATSGYISFIGKVAKKPNEDKKYYSRLKSL